MVSDIYLFSLLAFHERATKELKVFLYAEISL
jgi:hypothetical protein